MGADRLIYIRTDGNSKIAAGHLVRCLSIARNCLKAGMSVCFLLSDEESRTLLDGFMTEDLKKNQQLSVKVLETAEYDNLENELPEILALLADSISSVPHGDANHVCNKKHVYLLDSYFVTESYLSALRPVAPIAYLDDLQLFDYPVDLLINYDVIPDAAMPSYKAAYTKAGKTLLGAAYTPLRSQFENKAITVRETASDILITTGGSDPYHFCMEFIREFTKHFSGDPSETIAHIPNLHIVIGRLNEDKESLYALGKEYPFINLYENVTDMAALMSTCDLAVSAAGTTLYELCSLGIPTISFTMADNQLISAKAFDVAGAIPCAGDIRENKEQVMMKVFDFIRHMSKDTDTLSAGPTPDKHSASYERRLDAHQFMRNLVDGGGAMRIAEELAQL